VLLIAATVQVGCRLGGASLLSSYTVFGSSAPREVAAGGQEPQAHGTAGHGTCDSSRLTVAADSASSHGLSPSGQNPPGSSPPLSPAVWQLAEHRLLEETDFETLIDQFCKDPVTRSKLIALVQQSDPQVRPLLLQSLVALAALGHELVTPPPANSAAPNSTAPFNSGPVHCGPTDGFGDCRVPSSPDWPAFSPPGDTTGGNLPGKTGDQGPGFALASSGSLNGPNYSSAEGDAFSTQRGSSAWLVSSGDYHWVSDDLNQAIYGFPNGNEEAEASTFHRDCGDRSQDWAEGARSNPSEFFGSSESSGPGWQEHLEIGLRLLERKLRETEEVSQRETASAKLMLLKLILGKRDAALKHAKNGENLQGFWLKELYGLSLLLDGALIGDRGARLGEALRHLDDALLELREECPVVVRNLNFVTEIQSFGVYTPFETEKFLPGQRVLLYAEVENFRSEPTAKGYHTACKSRVEILDPQGNRVAVEDFPVTEEYCRNRRRDFFLGFELQLPTQLHPGRHTLELTVTDIHSGRVGRSAVEFQISASSSGR